MDAIYLFLTEGFEEAEAIGTLDVLRRAGLPVQSVSLDGSLLVKGKHDVFVTADLLMAQADTSHAAMLAIPGGTVRFNESEPLREAVKAAAARGAWIAAICAAPIVPGSLGLLKGRRATVYPGFAQYLEGAILEEDKPVVVDGRFITGRGPGLVFDFALTIVRELAGETRAREVAEGMLLA